MNFRNIIPRRRYENELKTENGCFIGFFKITLDVCVDWNLSANIVKVNSVIIFLCTQVNDQKETQKANNDNSKNKFDNKSVT